MTTKISINDLRALKKSKVNRKAKVIKYLNSLKELKIPNDYIALLIIPSFHQQMQGEYLDESFFLNLLQIPEEKDRWNNYSETIHQTGKLIDEIFEDINQFFVCQNYHFENEWLKDLQFTYKLLEDCKTFPHDFPKAIPRLWYHRKLNGHIEIITPTEDFISLCKDRDKKLNILFLHAKHITWLKNFFKDHEKKIVHILPEIHLFLIKIK